MKKINVKYPITNQLEHWESLFHLYPFLCLTGRVDNMDKLHFLIIWPGRTLKFYLVCNKYAQSMLIIYSEVILAERILKLFKTMKILIIMLTSASANSKMMDYLILLSNIWNFSKQSIQNSTGQIFSFWSQI